MRASLKPMRPSSLRIIIAAGVAVVAITALAACGNPPRVSTHAATSVSAATVTAAAPGATQPVRPEPAPLDVTQKGIRTPTVPPAYACSLLGHHAVSTADDLAREHGIASGCYQQANQLILEVPGARSGDSRPGFIVCVRPANVAGPYCGAGLGPAIARTQSYAANWYFYPYPATDAKPVGDIVFQQEYQCVGNASQLWAFHLDTYTFTSGCQPPPSYSGIALRLCDAFMYLGAADGVTKDNGKALACGLFGTTVVGVVDGHPRPGLVLCQPPASAAVAAASRYCGLDLIMQVSAWQFIPLPVATGPVTGATFDTAGGTACISAAGQSFTFTVATRAVTPGCSAAPVATATP